VLSLGDRISLSSDVIYRDLGGEMVALNLQTGQYYGLDAVGSRMLLTLTETGRFESALELLLSEYDVSGPKLREDLLRLVEELITHGILHVDPA
jgi:hypothetical protein